MVTLIDNDMCFSRGCGWIVINNLAETGTLIPFVHTSLQVTASAGVAMQGIVHKLPPIRTRPHNWPTGMGPW